MVAKTSKSAAASLAFAVLLCTLSLDAAHAIDLRGSLWERIARTRDLDPYLLYSLAIAESSIKRDARQISPWPWTLGTPNEAVYARTREEAEARLRLELARANDKTNLDVGLMQISTLWHGWRVRSPVDLLEPEVNLRIAADVLVEAMRSSPNDPILGIGRYHSWNTERARWYGERVFAIYRELISTINERPLSENTAQKNRSGKHATNNQIPRTTTPLLTSGAARAETVTEFKTNHEKLGVP